MSEKYAICLSYLGQRLSWVFLPVLLCLSFQAQSQITTYPYFENFDSGAGGWSASTSGSNGWTLGTPNKPIINSAYSAPNSWMTGTATGNYSNSFNAYVQSPVFDLTTIASPLFKMNVWWESEFSWDGANLQVSTDGGTTFQIMGGYQDPINWFSDNTINSLPGGSQLGWTGLQATGNGSNSWRTVQHLLTGMGGQPSVIIRIYFSSDNVDNYDGFAFDDVGVMDNPLVYLGGDTTICFADTLILDAGFFAEADYTWRDNFSLPDPGDTLQLLPVFESGIYFINIVDTLGFILRDTIDLVVSGTFVNLGPDQLICPGDTLFLNAFNASASHIWLPGNIPSQTFSVVSNGTYTVTVVDSVGCIEIDSINVAIDFVPTVNLGPDTTICVGQSLILDGGAGTPGTQYLWNFGASTQTVFVSAPGPYNVLVTTSANCTETDSMFLDVVLSPVVDLGPDRIECGTFVLDANNAGSSFLWSNGDTTQTLTSTTPGPFWVEVSNPFGCFARDSVVITPGSVPTVNLGGDKVICNGSSVTLDAGNPGLAYFWSNGSTAQTIVVSQPGQYFVNVTNVDGCIGKDTANVILSPLTLDLGPDANICEGVPYLLDAGDQGLVYTWSTGDPTQAITVTTGGLYSVSVTDSAGCSANDDIILTAQPNFTADFEMVPDTAVLFQVLQFNDLSSGNPNSWLWEFGDGNVSSAQNPSHGYVSIGTFMVYLTASDGVCTNVDSLEVMVDIFADIDDELAGVSINLYPNPNSGQFALEIEMDQPQALEIAVFDITGRSWYRETSPPAFSQTRQIDLGSVTKGLYLMRISTSSGATTYRKVMIR